MAVTITRLEALDIRFPTSRWLDGSDAMNPDPDYSAAYCILHTDDPALSGHGFTFTIGRGTDLVVAGVRALAHLVEGRTLDEITADMGAFWRSLAGDSQMRWLGPEKGVVHLALAAVVNATWDLWGKAEGKPVWRLIADMTPAEVVRLIDFRHITDALTPAEAEAIIAKTRSSQGAMTAALAQGYPAYTTSAGWLGYPDDQIRRLCGEAVAAGWDAIKMKVGRDRADDIRRCAIVREAIGPDRKLMVDANQVWEVGQAIEWVNALKPFDIYWIEEPVSPDDILGHGTVRDGVAPVRVATGEHAHNRVMFKQLLQAGAVDVVQFDCCRLGGVNEALAVLLLAAKFGVPVCQHAGGVGLCEVGQHLAFVDALVISGGLEGRMFEHAAHLHEHFVDPIHIKAGRYLAPEAPGFSTEIRAASRAAYAFPHGSEWAD